MADRESQLAAGRRLAQDLHSIRRKRGVDLKEILDVTRLAEDVIDQLEESGLIDHPAFNRVYLRSLYSSYAPVVGITVEHMVAALDEAMSGHYVGSLATIYLGDSENDDHGESEIDRTDSGLNVDPENDPDDDSKDRGPKDVEVAKELEDVAETTPDPVSDSVDETNEEGKTEREAESPVSHPQKSESSDSAGTLSSSKSKFFTSKLLAGRESVLLPNMSGALLVGLVGVASIALIWFSISWVLSLGEEEVAEVVAPDSTFIPELVLPSPIVLPDTIVVDIIAQTEALDPIRVTLDRDLRKPYWIEHNDTLSFSITDRILIEREVDHARFLIDGFRAPSEWFDGDQPVELSRSVTQDWLDSLTEAGINPERSRTPR